MARLEQDSYIPVIIHDEFVLALFDKGLSQQPLDKVDKWQHLRDAGYMIDRLYTLSKNNDEEAKQILKGFVTVIDNQINAFNDLVTQLWTAYEKPVSFKKPVGKQAFAHWDNKMFLSLVQLTQDLDAFSCELKELKARKAISNKDFRKCQHKATGRLRHILNHIYTTCKTNKAVLYPNQQEEK